MKLVGDTETKATPTPTLRLANSPIATRPAPVCKSFTSSFSTDLVHIISYPFKFSNPRFAVCIQYPNTKELNNGKLSSALTYSYRLYDSCSNEEVRNVVKTNSLKFAYAALE